MKKKQMRAVIALLVLSTTMQSYAAGWSQIGNDWYWIKDDDNKAMYQWTQDTDGKWYYVGNEGKMQTGWLQDPSGNWYYLNPNSGDPMGSMAAGWKLVNNVWYFFNTIRDGTYGKVMTGWNWIDGYCYYFEQDGTMLSNSMTPDGYFVNENGAWVNNGNPVYVRGKGMITKTETGMGTSASTRPSGGGSHSGGGGSSSGSFGGGSSSPEIKYTYTVKCIDKANGNVLKEEAVSAKKNQAVAFSYYFDNYKLIPGQNTTVSITENGMEFILYYEENIEIPEEENYAYVINYIDTKTKDILFYETFKGNKGDTIQIKYPEIDGYEAEKGQIVFFALDEDNKVIDLFYVKKETQTTEYSFTVQYLNAKTDDILGEKTGVAKANSMITVNFLEFDKYEVQKGQQKEYQLTADGLVFKVYYDKESEIATPSEPEPIKYKYTVLCYNFDTGEQIGTYSNAAEADSEIEFDYMIDGYTMYENYIFIISKEDETFEAYYKRDKKSEEEFVEYTVKCIDSETDDILETHKEKGRIGAVIEPEYKIEGYTVADTYSFEITEDNEVFQMSYDAIQEEGQLEFIIHQIDIDTKKELGTVTLLGAADEEVIMGDIDIENYEMLGTPPESVIISSVVSNNEMNIYYKELSDYNPDAKEVSFEVEFVDANDHNVHILDTVTGKGNVGDEVPIYFQEKINTQDRRVWESIGYSPRLFTLTDKSYNLFTVEYLNKEDLPEIQKKEVSYSIRYVAEDTGAVLGITSGMAVPGTKIPYRNTFPVTGYGLKDPNTTKMTVSENELENRIEVIYKRVSLPGPDRNPITGKYDGNNWMVLFRDTEGNYLLPEIRGFSLKDTGLMIDYPNVIEKDGYTYRAEYASPYREIQNGTTYRQIEIRYVKGESSETKLDYWKQKAQEAKNIFNHIVPYGYKIVYKERNSWNDIGVAIGVDYKDKHIEIPIYDIQDYTSPEEKIEGFDLTEDEMEISINYDRFASGTSIGYKKVPYTIYFKDPEGNDLFESYSGLVAAASDEAVVDLPVFYPKTFTDAEENIWETDRTSTTLKIDTLSLNENKNVITYRKTFDSQKTNNIVKDQNDALTLFENYAGRITDSNEKKFYMIGEDYSPHDLIPNELMSLYNLYNYSNNIVDSFELDGKMYTVCEIYITRKWNQAACEHDWKTVKTIDGSCFVSGSSTVECTKCNKTEITIIPALGHIDENNDSICDTCGKRAFTQILGDEIKLQFDSGVLASDVPEYHFICIDDNYKNTGKMLYMCEENITSDMYGTYSNNGQADFESSKLKYFLNDEFADGLSLKSSLQEINNGRVSILSKKEYETYKQNAENKYIFPEGTCITSSSNQDGANVILSNGAEVSAEDASNYSVKPVILMDRPEVEEPIVSVWKVGDVQARKLGDKIYLFRCVNESYKDKTNTSKTLALFLCDNVIPASIVNDPKSENIETLHFGNNNNYKYSNIRQWLEDNKTDALFNIGTINIGTQTAYMGSTQKNGFSQLNEKLLQKYDIGKQYLEGQIYIPSMEEALEMRNYLWKFNGSDIENPETQEVPFCEGYYLRTSVYGTDDQIYRVNLHEGKIEPVAVNATENNDYSTTGIRPIFAMEQIN